MAKCRFRGSGNVNDSGRGGASFTLDGVTYRRAGAGASGLLAALAARVWVDVTEGKGAVLNEAGKPVEPAKPKGVRKALG